MKLLIFSTIVLLLSIFAPAYTEISEYRVMALGFIQYIIVLVYRFQPILKFSFADFVKYNNDQASLAYGRKDCFRSSVYFIVAPMLLFGVFMIVITIGFLLIA